MIITSSGCTFYDYVMGKMIVHPKLRDGLYYLDADLELNNLNPQGLVSTTTSRINQIWLSHRWLGHSSFTVLKRLFPYLFANIDIKDL